MPDHPPHRGIPVTSSLCPATRVSGNVSLLDIFPTVLDLACAGRPFPTLADPIDGNSLLPMLHHGNKGTGVGIAPGRVAMFVGCSHLLHAW